MSLAESVRRQLEDLLRSLGDGVRATPFAFLTRTRRNEPMPKPPADTYGFVMDISGGADEEPEEAPAPVVFQSPYSEPADQAPTSWEQAKARNYGAARPPGSTSCEPGPERKTDEFRQRLPYNDGGRADVSPDIVFGDGRPKPDEIKRYAKEIAAGRTFHRPHEPIRPRSIEKQIEDL